VGYGVKGAHTRVLAGLDAHADLLENESAQRNAVALDNLVLPRVVLRVARVSARVGEEQRLEGRQHCTARPGRTRTFMSLCSACPTRTLPARCAATSFCTSSNGLASRRQRACTPRRKERCVPWAMSAARMPLNGVR
jgi:hypothetical protein